MTAQEFWKKASLTNVEILIDDYKKYAEEETSFGLNEMYMQDRKDFEKVVELFRADDPEKLSTFIDRMDTSPREEVVVALAKDLGKDWVSQTLGWNVS